MTETTIQNDATAEDFLAGLTAHGCDWKPDGFDAWTGSCPCCRDNMLAVRIDDESKLEVECPSSLCTSDSILDAAFAPVPDVAPEASPSVDVPAVASPVSSSVTESPSLESEGHGTPETHAGPESHGGHGTHGPHESHGPLGLLGEAISRAITETLPTEPKATGKGVPKSLAVNSLAWRFARHLKSIPELRNLEMPKLLEVLETASVNWHETASELFQNPELLPEKDRFVEEVIVCFGDAKTGIDESRLYVATIRAQSSPYSDSNLTPPQQVVAALCRNLAEQTEDGEFFLSEQGAADAATVAKRSGTAALRKLVMLHLIEVIRKGTNDKGVKGRRPKRQATQYRWIGPVPRRVQSEMGQ